MPEPCPPCSRPGPRPAPKCQPAPPRARTESGGPRRGRAPPQPPCRGGHGPSSLHWAGAARGWPAGGCLRRCPYRRTGSPRSPRSRRRGLRRGGGPSRQLVRGPDPRWRPAPRPGRPAPSRRPRRPGAPPSWPSHCRPPRWPPPGP